MIATDVQPFRFRFAITTWGTALLRVRVDQDLLHKEVADRVGTSKAVVKAWENGLGYPNAQQLKRLYGSMRKLRRFANLLPREVREEQERAERESGELVELEVSVPAAQLGLPPLPSRPGFPPPAPPEAAPGPVQEIDEPRTFRDALRLARQLEGFHQHEVADLMGVAQGTVSTWELGSSTPVQEHYEKLVDLFEVLRDAPRPPGLRAIPKPVGNVGPRPPLPPAPPSRPLPSGAGLPPTRAPEDVGGDGRGFSEALLPPIEKLHPQLSQYARDLEQAGVEYARELGELERVRREHARARAEVENLARLLEQAERGAGAALERLRQAARGGGPDGQG